MRTATLALLGAGLVLPGFATAATGGTAVRVGDHPGFGRIVFDLPGGVAYHLSRSGDRVSLRFDGAGQVTAAPRLPRNVHEIEGGDSQAEITLAAGARLRTMRLGSRLVIDVLDAEPAPARSLAKNSAVTKTAPEPPPARVAATPEAVPQSPHPAPKEPIEAAGSKAPEADAKNHENSEPAPPVHEAAAPPATPIGQSAPAPPQPPAPAPSPATVPAGAGDPLALMAQRVALPAGTEGSAVVLPFGRNVGAASFPRGKGALVVFDAPRPIDLSGLRGDPVFGMARVQMLPDATVLQIPIMAGQALRLDRTSSGWMMVVSAAATALKPIDPAQEAHALALPVTEPGHVVVVPDPETGGNLLVGTQRVPGEGVPVRRRAPSYALGRTWQGVLVEPLSDRLELRALPDRFVLSGRNLDLTPFDSAHRQSAEAAALTRRFDLPDLPEPALRRRLQVQVDAAAQAAPLSRFVPRYQAAETMVALGMGVEAQALLHLAMADDPRHVADPDAIGLAAIAALLAGRDTEAGGLDDQRLSGTDEIAFWRAVRAARRPDGAAQAAPVFATTLKLLLSYPTPLRDRLLPLVAETMVEGGAVQAAGELIARHPGDPALAFAHALLLQKKGDRDEALHAFDALATGPDRLVRARAAERAVEMRLAAGRLDPRRAADALERLLLAWRGDDRERALRLRIAGLRRQNGEWRASLDLLRETEALFPAHRPEIHIVRADTFAAMLKDRQHVAPLDLVTLAEENADVAPDGQAGDDLASLLADRLMELDLPHRAEVLLDRLARSAPPGAARAAYGARLAQLRLEDGNAAGAVQALADSDSPDLTAALKERRTLLAAQALLRQQQAPGALAALASVDSASADDLRATILAGRKDWAGAVGALRDMVAKSVPAEGKLTDDQQRILLRLASAAAEAGDESALRELRERQSARMSNPQLAGMFRLLTGAAVQRLSELPVVAREIAMARALPADLRALSAPQPGRDPVMQ